MSIFSFTSTLLLTVPKSFLILKCLFVLRWEEEYTMRVDLQQRIGDLQEVLNQTFLSQTSSDIPLRHTLPTLTDTYFIHVCR